jgi:putative restriction endonuclease
MQLPRQLAVALMMPKPVRADDALGSGHPILKSDRYAIEHIAISRATLVGSTGVLLAVGDLELRNYNLHAETLDTRERVAQVAAIWDRASELPGGLSALLAVHQTAVRSGEPISAEIERSVADLQEAVTIAAQDLGILYRQGGEDVVPDILVTLRNAEVPPQPPIAVDQVDPAETEIKRRTVREWKRWVAVRGAASARFSQDVRRAYNWTCVVCGLYLPSTGYNRVPGVDGAHILPWANYELDVVANGLCLCKQHHWAFDEALIRIRWEYPSYIIDVPEEASRRVQADKPGFSMDSFRAHVGVIPDNRLPARQADRPNPAFLTELNESEA